MTRQECIEQLNYLSFTAAMNQRYHQHKWSHFQRMDRNIRVSVGIIASIGVVVSVLGAATENFGVDVSSAIVSIVGLGIAIALNISPSNDKEVVHRDLFRRWSDMREEVDTLLVKVESNNSPNVAVDSVNRLQDLTSKKNRINALETAPDDQLLNHCYELENKARTGFATQEEMEDAQNQTAGGIEPMNAVTSGTSLT